nr:hypothetical protein [Tanacetum cinerariifolium]
MGGDEDTITADSMLYMAGEETIRRAVVKRQITPTINEVFYDKTREIQAQVLWLQLVVFENATPLVLRRFCRYLAFSYKSDVFSQPPTSNIEDAFSSTNTPDYTLASPDYFLASPGNTSSDSSNNLSGLVPIASLTLSLFHDDPYMKFMHAYDAIIPPSAPITLSAVLTPSPMLPPSFSVYTPTPP